MKRLAILLLILAPLHGGAPKQPAPRLSSSKFPLPLPRSYKMPHEIQECAVYALKMTDSISDFKEHYKLVLEDKADMKELLARPLMIYVDVNSHLAFQDGPAGDSFRKKAEMLDALMKW